MLAHFELYKHATDKKICFLWKRMRIFHHMPYIPFSISDATPTNYSYTEKGKYLSKKRKKKTEQKYFLAFPPTCFSRTMSFINLECS